MFCVSVCAYICLYYKKQPHSYPVKDFTVCIHVWMHIEHERKKGVILYFLHLFFGLVLIMHITLNTDSVAIFVYIVPMPNQIWCGLTAVSFYKCVGKSHQTQIKPTTQCFNLMDLGRQTFKYCAQVKST